MGDPRHVDSSGIGFDIMPLRVLHILLAVIAILVALSTADQAMVYYGRAFPGRDLVARLLFVDAEQSIPNLYSTIMLLVAALLFGVISNTRRRQGGTYLRHWTMLSLIFVVLAADEFMSLHEETIVPLRRGLHIHGGGLWYAWVIPGAILVAVFVLAYLPFLRHLPRPTRRRLWTAGVLYVGGAIGLEVIGAAYGSAHREGSMGAVLIATVEETLEMVGVAVLVYALLDYIREMLPNTPFPIRVTAGN